MGVALCLGLGTMVGWKRIVVTVGEKICKTHLSYAQGGVAELVAAGTIGLADGFGMPVSTTHVLSSGVAGTMWANKSGIQGGTVREIALAWIITLPAVILLSALIYWVATLFTGLRLPPFPPAPSMRSSLDPTAERALKLNLDDEVYGTFAEIGAGQEVARWFFAVGGAAGTVAKTMSAYDMTVSDAVYGKAARYVSRQRVQEMLDHEYGLLHERLDAARGERTRFFTFADTAAARSFRGGNECHAWLVVRFQHACRAEPSDVLIHVRMLDATNAAQQEALGRLGVNLLHGALHRWREPPAMIELLLDDVGRELIELDWITVKGPAFPGIDNRLLALHLVRLGFTPAVLFDPQGVPQLASEAIRHSAVLV